MLYIGRKKGETITFILASGEEIIIKIANCDEDFGANIAIKAPQSVRVWRGEYNGEKLLENDDVNNIIQTR